MGGDVVKLGVWLPVVAAPRILSRSAGHYADQLAALAGLTSGEDR
jgi:hypothetical protein